YPEIFEEIFKFPTNELDFVQQDIKSNSFRYRYFSNYIFYDDNGLQVKTIIVEKNYTCQTFIEDYINYYARCYTRYNKNCRRIHLFKEDFDNNQFQEMLYSTNNNELWKSYLGCIVIKPLPKSIIGVTYLKIYDGNESKSRYYTAISPQSINLYGTSLKVNTMPFIEQDSNVGACASTALWMAFQKTSDLFHTKKLSPSDITLLAGFDIYSTGNFFPNKGLEVAQICKVIYNNGLHSELRVISEKHEDGKIEDHFWLRGFIYAYLKAEIPVLLGVEIENIGLHLITLNGYRFRFNDEVLPESNLFYKSQFITKFYAHDDQIGPFSRLKFNKKGEYYLRTSWRKTNVDWNKSHAEIKEYFKKDDSYDCKPICLIVPLDRQIKVTYEDVIVKIKIINFLFSTFLQKSFVWDIFLIKSNRYKEQTKKRVKQKENLRELLYTSLPLYIWVAQVYTNEQSEEPICDFIFDSVEMPYDGKPFLANIYSQSFKDCFDKFNVQIRKLFSDDIENTVYKKFVENMEKMKELLDKELELEDDNEEVLSEERINDTEEDTINEDIKDNDISNNMGKIANEVDDIAKADEDLSPYY
ncbi:MAG: hypothetical protein LBD41_05910, partial [Clostridiales Family XIII bacterium]|nr:hypothetical protein [Clostridiales Family XIII bacterium]